MSCASLRNPVCCSYSMREKFFSVKGSLGFSGFSFHNPFPPKYIPTPGRVTRPRVQIMLSCSYGELELYI